MGEAAYLLLGIFILFAYTAEAVTGFGSVLISLSLGALFFPIPWLQTVLVPLNVFLCGFLAWKHRQYIDRDVLLKTILPFMLTGTVAGYLLQALLAGVLLKFLLATMVLWFALRELYRMRYGLAAPQLPRWRSRLTISLAGGFQGLYSSGGPLLVYGLSGLNLDKARFRATLLAVWLCLNGVLTALFLWHGRLQPEWRALLTYLPLIPLGIWLGEHLHHRVNEHQFRRWIYRLLVLAALALMLATVMAL